MHFVTVDVCQHFPHQTHMTVFSNRRLGSRITLAVAAVNGSPLAPSPFVELKYNRNVLLSNPFNVSLLWHTSSLPVALV
jgi:hypothetical protein